MEKTKYEFNCKSLEEPMFLKVKKELTANTSRFNLYLAKINATNRQTKI
jgi:hypothetical protein